MLRQRPQRLLNELVPLPRLDVGNNRVRDGKVDFGLLLILTPHLREKPPAPAIPRKMIESQVGGHRLEPPPSRRARAQ